MEERKPETIAETGEFRITRSTFPANSSVVYEVWDAYNLLSGVSGLVSGSEYLVGNVGYLPATKRKMVEAFDALRHFMEKDLKKRGISRIVSCVPTNK